MPAKKSTSSRPVKRAPRRSVLSDEIYEMIKGMIFDHEIAPGSRVNIDALAVQLDVTKSTMSSWCNHHSEPNLTYIYKASDILNVQLTELLADKANLKKK